MSEVLHYDDHEPELLKAMWDPSGGLKAVKSAVTVAMPTNSEELRSRITVLGTAWMFAGFQQTSCRYLAGLSPQLWQEYLDYLLGDYVHLLAARDEHGQAVGQPSWQLVLSYELEIRREALRLHGATRPEGDVLQGCQGVHVSPRLRPVLQGPLD